MTYRKDIKDICVIPKNNDIDIDSHVLLEIRHKNNLILDNVSILVFSSMVSVQYTKPYSEKYLGLVVEWIVNNLKPYSNFIHIHRAPSRTGSIGPR